MTQWKQVVGMLIIFLAGGLPAADATALTCSELERACYAAYQSEDLERMENLLGQMMGCPEARADGLRRAAALAWHAALNVRAAGADEAQQVAALQRVLTFFPQWQAHAALGDLAQDRREYANAAVHYQAALDAISDDDLTPVEPDAEIIERILRNAQISSLLAPEYVSTTRTRSGAPGGLASTRVRAIMISRVALPITFEFNCVAFTPKGREAAADLLDYLKWEPPAAITLIGHTDPRGGTAHNQRLSERRAEAVADYLRRHGFGGQIHTEGRGYREPFGVDQPERYTQQELYQMHRRVELQR